MDKDELKTVIGEQLESFKKSLPNFIDEKSLETAFKQFRSDIEGKFGEAVEKGIKDLSEAVKKQGEVLSSMKNQSTGRVKSFEDLLKEKSGEFDAMIKAGGAGMISINTSLKTVQSSNVGSDTGAFRDQSVGQIQRGMPYMRDLFPQVFLSGGTHGDVKWYEQLAVTNNAGNVAEVRTAPTASNLTWVEKTLNSRRIMDWCKISVDSLKDIAFVRGEITALINKNMKIKENSQLLSGLGTGNEIAGINTYATDFVTTGVSVKDAQLVDLINQAGVQIAVDMLGGALPNYWVANPADVQKYIRARKDANNRYLFEAWALGANPTIGNMQAVENALVTPDTLLVGDFERAILYIWDDLIIEIAQIEDDKKTGLTTIIAYMRENLRVNDVDKKAFVKIASIDTDLKAISESVLAGGE
jgi:HK97 family phage major capsid protein